MLCLEMWLYEVAMIVSGLLPNAQVGLAVSGICVQLLTLAFMVPLGVSVALRIRVSNLLGTHLPHSTPCLLQLQCHHQHLQCTLAGARFSWHRRKHIRQAWSW
jgi:MatE